VQGGGGGWGGARLALDRTRLSLARADFVPVPPGPEPGFDHADVWLGDGHALLYVAHTGADRVDVIDCRERRFLRSLDALAGVAVFEERD
jgi:hypothetical protein